MKGIAGTARQRTFREIRSNQKALMKWKRVRWKWRGWSCLYKYMKLLCRTIVIKGWGRNVGLGRIPRKDTWSLLSPFLFPGQRLARSIPALAPCLVWVELAGTGLRWCQGAECVMPKDNTIIQATCCMRTCPMAGQVTSQHAVTLHCLLVPLLFEGIIIKDLGP